jgi:hypothetical protein
MATGGSGGLVSGAHGHCGPFNTVCEEANIYQLWTQEYVQHLGDYLIRRASSAAATLVLDIGAGDGLLLHYLQEYYHQQQQQRRGGQVLPTMTWKATDNGSWRIFAKAQVEQCNVQQALQKYASATTTTNTTGNDNDNDPGPTLSSSSSSSQQRQQTKPVTVIVLCSWMPMGQDWTQLFRDAASYNVDEYILIGEADDGSCGHNWKTWGNADFREMEDEEEENKEEEKDDHNRRSVSGSGRMLDRRQPRQHRQRRPAYEQDGYQRWDMDALAPFQFSRFDCAVSKSGKTVSFRRRQRTRRGSGSGGRSR